MYGRKARLPIDLKTSTDSAIDPMHPQDDVSPAILRTLIEIHDKLRSTVSSNIHSAQEHQKRCFDRRHNSKNCVTAGSTVYVKNHRRIHRMGSKMEPRWIGPFKVVESLTKGRVKLMNINTGTTLSNTYHASNLKFHKHADASPPFQPPPVMITFTLPMNAQITRHCKDH